MTVIVVDCQVEHQMTIAVMRKGEPMSDLISRLSELRSQYSCFNESERGAYHTLSEAIEALQEQKTGKWIAHDCLGQPSIDNDVCSACGTRFYQIAETGCIWNYCPNCGAKMEEEQ